MNEGYTRGLRAAKAIILHSTSLKHALDSIHNAIYQSLIFDEKYLKEDKQ